jgi:hypothetical protein
MKIKLLKQMIMENLLEATQTSMTFPVFETTDSSIIRMLPRAEVIGIIGLNKQLDQINVEGLHHSFVSLTYKRPNVYFELNQKGINFLNLNDSKIKSKFQKTVQTYFQTYFQKQLEK